jgi:hypothetical protein
MHADACRSNTNCSLDVDKALVDLGIPSICAAQLVGEIDDEVWWPKGTDRHADHAGNPVFSSLFIFMTAAPHL